MAAQHGGRPRFDDPSQTRAGEIIAQRTQDRQAVNGVANGAERTSRMFIDDSEAGCVIR